VILAGRDRIAQPAHQISFNPSLRAQAVIRYSDDQIIAPFVEPSSLVHPIQAERVCHPPAIMPPAPAADTRECPVRHLYDLNR